MRDGDDADALSRELGALLKNGDVAGARQTVSGRRAPVASVAASGLENYSRGSDAVSEAMAGTKARLRIDLERNLGVLGTLGNNAPFIGLFGTVLGIIKAFARPLAATRAAAPPPSCPASPRRSSPRPSA